MPQSGKIVESDKWGWKHVTVHGGFHKGSGTKRWKCNHCSQPYNGSYSRVRAHLLGFAGFGVKSCPSIDRSLREALGVLEGKRLAGKQKKASFGIPKRCNGKDVSTYQPHPSSSLPRTLSREDVDDAVARFLYADGVNLNIVTSPFFQEMTRSIAAFGQKYEPPSVEVLSDSSLSKEKARIERAITIVKESWPHTGCTILCINRLDCSISCFCINFFVASPRGVVFLKTMVVNERGEADSVFISALSDTIIDVGPTNVLQVITHLGQASFAFEPVIVSKFPRVFWSQSASHSISMLMEEISEIDWIKTVLLYARGIDQNISTYQSGNSCPIIDNMIELYNPLAVKFAPYGIVHKLCGMKQALQELVGGNEWKLWKLNLPEDSITYDSFILDEEFWGRAHLMLQIFEPFLALSSTLNIDASILGDLHNWRVQSLEAVRSKGIDDIALNQIELLIESRWDSLFSALHAAGYILNPKYFGKGQSKDTNVMRGWKATLERYESDSEMRRTLREELSSYWRLEGSLGEEDAVESREKMDPVAWWENFGFETPHLRTLAVKVLSQVSSVSVYEGSWLCKESVAELELTRAEDLLFVQNNLRLQSQKHRNGFGPLLGFRNKNQCCSSSKVT